MHVAGISISSTLLAVYCLTAAVLFLLWYISSHTELGLAMRAASQDIAIADAMGIDSHFIISVTFIIGSAIAAVAGILVGIFYNQVYPTMGAVPAYKTLAIIVVGGMGSVPGALLLAVLAGLGVGAISGLCNGLFISKVGINPFITTLGMMVIIRGIVFVITRGQSIYDFPFEYNVIGMGMYGYLPIPLTIWMLVVLFCYILLKHTTFGQYVYAVGGNEKVAHLSGINADRIKILAAMLCGALASLGGIVLLFRVMSALPQAGNMYELYAIAATVLGGCALGGGTGGVLGTVIGALLLGVIINGLHMVGVSAYWEATITGVIILFAVSIDVVSQKLASRS
jgi:ribose/xylose/arabinose/galactoside ABC-type transport system permease subunit